MPMTFEDWSERVRVAMTIARMTQRQLADELTRRLARPQPFSQTTVTRWLSESAPDPATVFAIEEVLDMTPGSASRHLGYLPVSAQPVATVLDAIAADDHLDELARGFLADAYRFQINETDRRRG